MRHIKEKATSERKRTNKQKAKLTQTTGRRSRGAGWGALRRGKGGPTRGDGRRRIRAVHTRWSTQTSRYEAAHRKRRVITDVTLVKYTVQAPRDTSRARCTRRGAGAHAPAGLGAGPGDTAPSLLLTRRPPSAACSGPGCRVRLCAPPLGPSPRTGWESADQGLRLAELSRSRATQQVTNAASGLPALAIKVSECRPGPRVLLSAADPQPTALRAPGKGGWRTAPPGHLCPPHGTRGPAAAPAGVASWPRRQKEGPLLTLPHFRPHHRHTLWFSASPCLLCAQCAICRRQVIKAVISLSTGISSLEKVPISV